MTRANATLTTIIGVTSLAQNRSAAGSTCGSAQAAGELDTTGGQLQLSNLELRLAEEQMTTSTEIPVTKPLQSE